MSEWIEVKRGSRLIHKEPRVSLSIGKLRNNAYLNFNKAFSTAFLKGKCRAKLYYKKISDVKFIIGVEFLSTSEKNSSSIVKIGSGSYSKIHIRNLLNKIGVSSNVSCYEIFKPEWEGKLLVIWLNIEELMKK